MTHPIFVCIEHERTMHTCRNVGIHCSQHHGMTYITALKQGIVVEIGECDPKAQVYGSCPDPHDRLASPMELDTAKRMKETTE